MRCNESRSLASRKRSEYYGQVIRKAGFMHSTRSTPSSERGITVLTLLLLIIALVIAAVFLVRYLRTRPAVSSAPSHVILSPSLTLRTGSPDDPYDISRLIS
jgi:hypothetical protein